MAGSQGSTWTMGEGEFAAVIPLETIVEDGVPAIIRDVRSVTGGGPSISSVDLDVLIRPTRLPWIRRSMG